MARLAITNLASFSRIAAGVSAPSDIMGRVIARMPVALLALLAVAVGACSDGRTSSGATSTAATSALETVVTDPTTIRSTPTSTPATAPTVPPPRTTASTVATTMPPAVGDDSVPAHTSTDSSAPPPTTVSDGVAVTDRDCNSETADASFDLLHVTVESLPSRYRMAAQYSGDAFQHDIVVSFDLGASTYLVTAELFEDGTGVARLTDVGSSEDAFLDPPQTITPGVVDLTVRNDQIGGISGTPFNVGVSLKVDGLEIETCQ
jgi:hypothetical protein